MRDASNRVTTCTREVIEGGIIPTSSELANWAAAHFERNQQHTANVLAGPKRETWFSAETFAALSGAARSLKENPLLPTFSCWGEQQFSKVFAKVKGAAGLDGKTTWKPDIVCYLPKDGDEAIHAVLELKLVLNDDEKLDAALVDLRGQLANARKLAPKAKVLGLVFLAAVPQMTTGTFDKKRGELKAAMERVLPDAERFSWVSGHEVESVFRTVYTTFCYPSMTVSLALGVRELAPT